MRYAFVVGLIAVLTYAAPSTAAEVEIREFDLPSGTRPHDVAPGPDGVVWYVSQPKGVLGRLDPATGKVEQIALGTGSSPHGVIVGPDGAPWITDGGQNAIVRVIPAPPRSSASRSREPRLRQPQHRNIRRPGYPVVHGTERGLRTPRSEDR
jgi:virginiamycin B lyase